MIKKKNLRKSRNTGTHLSVKTAKNNYSKWKKTQSNPTKINNKQESTQFPLLFNTVLEILTGIIR